jgi:hypothetical protein
MELWKPKSPGERVVGIFIGFTDWEFRENETTWLMTIQNGDDYSALPNWHSIRACYLANDKVIVPGVRLVVTFVKSVQLDDRSDMKIAKIEIIDDQGEAHELLERRIVTSGEEVRALLT